MFENLILAEFLVYFCSPKLLKLWRKGVHIWHKNHDDEDNDNVKKQLVLWAKQQLCTCITPFSTFLWRPLHEYEEKSPNATFYKAREHTATNFPVSFWTRIKPWEFTSTKNRLHLRNWAGRNRRDRVCSDVFHCRRRRGCLSFLLTAQHYPFKFTPSLLKLIWRIHWA